MGSGRRMQVAAALAARHIGGAVNYVGVAGALDIPCVRPGGGVGGGQPAVCSVLFLHLPAGAQAAPGPPSQPCGL